jgi:hypothetical protein
VGSEMCIRDRALVDREFYLRGERSLYCLAE